MPIYKSNEYSKTYRMEVDGGNRVGFMFVGGGGGGEGGTGVRTSVGLREQGCKGGGIKFSLDLIII